MQISESGALLVPLFKAALFTSAAVRNGTI